LANIGKPVIQAFDPQAGARGVSFFYSTQTYFSEYGAVVEVDDKQYIEHRSLWFDPGPTARVLDNPQVHPVLFLSPKRVFEIPIPQKATGERL
jgi:hypothetical protein